MGKSDVRCAICKNPALVKCGRCYQTLYCTKHHQKDDWKQHKRNCIKPVKVVEDSQGCSITTARNLTTGEIILQEYPLLWGPSTLPVCLGCGKKLTKECRPCIKCGWPVCGDLCEKSPSHLPECRYTAQRGERMYLDNIDIPQPIYQCIIVLRCLYQKQFLPKNWKKFDGPRCKVNLPKKTQGDGSKVTNYVRRFFKLFSTFSEDEVFRVWTTVKVKGVDVPLEAALVGIYSTASELEHSCSPNCTKSFNDKGQIVITAAKSIPTGSKLTLSYVDPLLSTRERRRLLYETKFFSCHCSRCEDPTEFGTYYSALKCTKPNCEGNLLPKSFTKEENLERWRCNSCSNSISVNSADDILEKIEDDHRDLDKNDPIACRDFLTTYSSHLPSTNSYLFNVKYHLWLLEGALNEMQLCQDLENLLEVLAPSEKRTLSSVLLKKYDVIKSGIYPEEEECKKVISKVNWLMRNEGNIFPTRKSCGQI